MLIETAILDAAPVERKKAAAPAARAQRSRGALHQDPQRAAPRLAPRRHLEQAVAFSLAPASLAACCVEMSLRASDLFELELPTPLVEFSISSPPAQGSDREAQPGRHAGSAGGAQPARRFAGRSSCQRPIHADVLARLLNPGEAERWLMLADLHEEFARTAGPLLEAAAGSALAAATTSATCLGWPPTNDEHVRRLSRRSHLELATRLAAGSPPLQLPAPAISRASSSRAQSASTAASPWHAARAPAGRGGRRRCRRRRLRRRSVRDSPSQARQAPPPPR